MRCVDCRREIRPVVIFDIDGTLGDYHWHLQEFLIDYLPAHLGWKPPGGSYPYNVEFSDWLGVPKDEYRRAKLAYRQGGTKRTMPVIELATTATKLAKHLGAEVWIATSRPWFSLDTIDPDTREWLARAEVRYDHLLYGDDKWVQILDRIEPDRIVAVFDDLPEQIETARSLGLPAYQFVTGHAEDAIRGDHVRSWPEGMAIIRSEIERWKSAR